MKTIFLHERPPMEYPIYRIMINDIPYFIQRMDEMNSGSSWYELELLKPTRWVPVGGFEFSLPMGFTKNEAIQNLKEKYSHLKTNIMKTNKKYYIGQRNNPQFDKPYYNLYGQLTLKEVEQKESCAYGSMYLTGYNSKEDYETAANNLKTEGFHVNDHSNNNSPKTNDMKTNVKNEKTAVKTAKTVKATKSVKESKSAKENGKKVDEIEVKEPVKKVIPQNSKKAEKLIENGKIHWNIEGEDLSAERDGVKFVIYPYGKNFHLQINKENKCEGTLKVCKAYAEDFVNSWKDEAMGQIPKKKEVKMEHPVGKVETKTEEQKPTFTRTMAMATILKDHPEYDDEKAIKLADSLYVKESGKSSNLKEQAFCCRYVRQMMTIFFPKS